MFYLGGMTVVAAGWVNPMTVYVDFVSQYDSGWLWQLYANRSLVGSTRVPSERRVVGQLVASALPAPLTLVRVDAASILVDYGSSLPTLPCNQFRLNWQTASMSADTAFFDVVAGTEPGGALDLSNVIARVPFVEDGPYSFELPPFEETGDWAVGLVPRDNALPLGNAGTPSSSTVSVVTPPPDLVFNEDGSRFSVDIAGGVLTAAFVWSE